MKGVYYDIRAARASRNFFIAVAVYVFAGICAFSLYFSRNYDAALAGSGMTTGISGLVVGALWPLYFSVQITDAIRAAPQPDCVQVERTK